ncbi:MAG: spermidine synthase, partial [Pseudorhizobium sp.]
MSSLFAELDYQVTPLGTLILRRRRDPSDDQDIFEIKLNDEFLMSSKFTASEEYLGRVPLKDLHGERLNVVVGGLGLGYTAVAALEDPRVATLLVVEALQPVIEWHQSQMLPLGRILADDARCR